MIVGGCVSLLHHDDFVEVFEGEGQSVAPDFFTNGAQVVECGYVVGLKQTGI